MFAFHVHAHTHGDVNTAYRVRNNQWTQIAKGDPQLPQAFYPTTESTFDIQNGDILMAICTYHNNETREIRQGSTHNDEMCNVYIMYYTENAENVQDLCGGHTYPELEQQIPADARVKPVQMGGSTEKLEPVPSHTMHHDENCVQEVGRLREEKLALEEQIKGLNKSLQALRSDYNTLEELFEKQNIYF